jgi:hypothetical protein
VLRTAQKAEMTMDPGNNSYERNPPPGDRCDRFSKHGTQGSRLLVVAGVGLLLGACSDGEWTASVDEIDFDVEAQLVAVTRGFGLETLYVAGVDGTVVSSEGCRWELQAPLHDLIYVHGVQDVKLDSRLIAVGDDGLVAVMRQPQACGAELALDHVGPGAELLAVAAYHDDLGLVVVAVGDDILVVGREDALGDLVWSEPTPPVDGWGQLRDVGTPTNLPGAAFSGDQLCALGAAGRLLCTSDLSNWDVVALSTDANLNGFCVGPQSLVVGDEGTLISQTTHEEWHVRQFKLDIDFIACTSAYHDPIVIASDRRIYVVGPDENLKTLLDLDWQPRAFDRELGTVMVGDAGRAGHLMIHGIIPQ